MNSHERKLIVEEVYRKLLKTLATVGIKLPESPSIELTVNNVKVQNIQDQQDSKKKDKLGVGEFITLIGIFATFVLGYLPLAGIVSMPNRRSFSSSSVDHSSVHSLVFLVGQRIEAKADVCCILRHCWSDWPIRHAP